MDVVAEIPMNWLSWDLFVLFWCQILHFGVAPTYSIWWMTSTNFSGPLKQVYGVGLLAFTHKCDYAIKLLNRFGVCFIRCCCCHCMIPMNKIDWTMTAHRSTDLCNVFGKPNLQFFWKKKKKYTNPNTKFIIIINPNRFDNTIISLSLAKNVDQTLEREKKNGWHHFSLLEIIVWNPPINSPASKRIGISLFSVVFHTASREQKSPKTQPSWKHSSF